MDVLSDIEIARKNQMVPIEKVASKLNLGEDSLQKFGHHIAKIDTNVLKNHNKNGKLIFWVGGSLSFIIYTIVVWAFTKAPIPMVGILIKLEIFFETSL